MLIENITENEEEIINLIVKNKVIKQIFLYFGQKTIKNNTDVFNNNDIYDVLGHFISFFIGNHLEMKHYFKKYYNDFFYLSYSV